MDVASRGGDPVHKGLMACNGILVRVDRDQGNITRYRKINNAIPRFYLTWRILAETICHYEHFRK
jgi:hypothetical protein